MKIKRFFQFALVVNFLLTVYFFFQQGISSGVSLPHFDKIGHFIAFFILAICFDFATQVEKKISVSLLVAYGISVEVVQSYIPGREASLGDIIADMAGVAFYFFVVCQTELVKRYKVQSSA